MQMSGKDINSCRLTRFRGRSLGSFWNVFGTARILLTDIKMLSWSQLIFRVWCLYRYLVMGKGFPASYLLRNHTNIHLNSRPTGRVPLTDSNFFENNILLNLFLNSMKVIPTQTRDPKTDKSRSGIEPRTPWWEASTLEKNLSNGWLLVIWNIDI
jgi:hypothetical protein